jgi:hypothetical protein
MCATDVQTGFKEANPGLFVIPVPCIKASIQRVLRPSEDKPKFRHTALALLFVLRFV